MLVGDFPFEGGPDSNGFTDPIAWITSHVPAGGPNTQADADTRARAFTDSRFIGTGVTFGANVNWDPAYELRWRDYAFAGRSSTVGIYQVTAISDPSYRLTNFWDPDR